MQWKTLLGIFLIIGSLLTLVFWETKGREILLLSPVLTACVDIEKGVTIDETYFKEARMLPENILNNAFLPHDASALNNLVSNCKICANQQLLPSYFQEEHTLLQVDESIFVLPALWIYSISSAVRAEDTVVLYSLPENICLGQYTVAFVKDGNDQEVRDVSGKQGDFLKRSDSTSEISHIEIICTTEEYRSICHVVTAAGFGNLLIVLKG